MAARLDDIELFDPDAYANGVPHETFARLRREAPVYRHPQPGASPFWAITRYRDVMAVSRDAATFSSERRGALLGEPPEEALAQQRLMMLNMDPPRHTKLRALVNKGFTPRMVGLLDGPVRGICAGLVDAAVERGECDFVTEIAAELPLQVIAELLGIPQADRHQIFEWSNTMVGAADPEFQRSPEEGQQAAMQMYAYANELALQRKDSPREDLVSVLMRAEVDGEQLTEMEFDLFFLLLAVAGNETTRNLISGGMLALMQHPDQWRRLLDDRSLVPTAVEEMLRWVTPVMQFQRTAQRDTRVAGVPIAEGERVALFYVSANRDEEVFDRPDTFDVGRSPNNHVAFGAGGPHHCLGNNLARLEIRIMFEELLERAPRIEQASPARKLRSNFLNGIKSMPVRMAPA
ncbi:MAG TPA: cytochrome P450 [Candidatus Dormibacteraeota bacterium]|nr:cytochrome P450 [Candidatus Dormibacteraeota bacterium]